MSASRYIDLVVSVRLCDVINAGRPDARWNTKTDEQLVRVGGRWDRRRRRFVKGAKTSKLVILRFHRGQEEGARWFAEWLRCFVHNEWANVHRVWSLLLYGGRRAGKTHLCCAIMFVFAILNPRARLWAISPTLETGDELDKAFAEIIPRRWYVRRQAKTGRATTYTLTNGSAIHLRSGVKPERLKAGRVDIALLNEAQEIDEKAYLKIRPAVADRGGFVLLAANPPDRPIGRWVEEHRLRAIAGEADAKYLFLDPRNNPWVNYEALVSMAKEADERTFQRDILGLPAPIGDIVFHAWDDRENWKDPTPDLVDVTPLVSRRELGAAAGDMIGEDFQRLPAMVAAVCRVLRDPATGAELLWVVDEAVVDEADEDGLCDALEGMPRWRVGDGPPSRREPERPTYRGWLEHGDSRDTPAHAALVMDASGFFQDGDHRQNRSSEKWLRARKWVHLHKPQKDSDKNPAIIERMRTGNALLKASDGTRRLFVARHCARTAEAMRSYENKNGSPNRRSIYAHIVDAVTYVAYRLYGRPKLERRGEYAGLGRYKRHDLYALR